MKYITEVYKCIVLTVIAVLLVVQLRRTPEPITIEKARSGAYEGWQTRIPLVRISGGSIDVDNTVSVDVTNTVEVEISR